MSPPWTQYSARDKEDIQTKLPMPSARPLASSIKVATVWSPDYYFANFLIGLA